jgi:hypothetical protein
MFYNIGPRCHFYKHFTAVSFEFSWKVFVPYKPFQDSLLFVGKAIQGPTLEWSTWKEFHLGTLLPYLQTLYSTGKACQE